MGGLNNGITSKPPESSYPQFKQNLTSIAHSKFGYVLRIQEDGSIGQVNILQALIEKISPLWRGIDRTDKTLVEYHLIHFLENGFSGQNVADDDKALAKSLAQRVGYRPDNKEKHSELQNVIDELGTNSHQADKFRHSHSKALEKFDAIIKKTKDAVKEIFPTIEDEQLLSSPSPFIRQPSLKVSQEKWKEEGWEDKEQQEPGEQQTTGKRESLRQEESTEKEPSYQEESTEENKLTEKEPSYIEIREESPIIYSEDLPTYPEESPNFKETKVKEDNEEDSLKDRRESESEQQEAMAEDFSGSRESLEQNPFEKQELSTESQPSEKSPKETVLDSPKSSVKDIKEEIAQTEPAVPEEKKSWWTGLKIVVGIGGLIVGAHAIQAFAPNVLSSLPITKGQNLTDTYDNSSLNQYSFSSLHYNSTAGIVNEIPVPTTTSFEAPQTQEGLPGESKKSPNWGIPGSSSPAGSILDIYAKETIPDDSGTSVPVQEQQDQKTEEQPSTDIQDILKGPETKTSSPEDQSKRQEQQQDWGPASKIAGILFGGGGLAVFIGKVGAWLFAKPKERVQTETQPESSLPPQGTARTTETISSSPKPDQVSTAQQFSPKKSQELLNIIFNNMVPSEAKVDTVLKKYKFDASWLSSLKYFFIEQREDLVRQRSEAEKISNLLEKMSQDTLLNLKEHYLNSFITTLFSKLPIDQLRILAKAQIQTENQQALKEINEEISKRSLRNTNTSELIPAEKAKKIWQFLKEDFPAAHSLQSHFLLEHELIGLCHYGSENNASLRSAIYAEADTDQLIQLASNVIKNEEFLTKHQQKDTAPQDTIKAELTEHLLKRLTSETETETNKKSIQETLDTLVQHWSENSLSFESLKKFIPKHFTQEWIKNNLNATQIFYDICEKHYPDSKKTDVFSVLTEALIHSLQRICEEETIGKEQAFTLLAKTSHRYIKENPTQGDLKGLDYTLTLLEKHPIESWPIVSVLLNLEESRKTNSEKAKNFLNTILNFEVPSEQEEKKFNSLKELALQLLQKSKIKFFSTTVTENIKFLHALLGTITTHLEQKKQWGVIDTLAEKAIKETEAIYMINHAIKPNDKFIIDCIKKINNQNPARALNLVKMYATELSKIKHHTLSDVSKKFILEFFTANPDLDSTEVKEILNKGNTICQKLASDLSKPEVDKRKERVVQILDEGEKEAVTVTKTLKEKTPRLVEETPGLAQKLKEDLSKRFATVNEGNSEQFYSVISTCLNETFKLKDAEQGKSERKKIYDFMTTRGFIDVIQTLGFIEPQYKNSLKIEFFDYTLDNTELQKSASFLIQNWDYEFWKDSNPDLNFSTFVKKHLDDDWIKSNINKLLSVLSTYYTDLRTTYNKDFDPNMDVLAEQVIFKADRRNLSSTQQDQLCRVIVSNVDRLIGKNGSKEELEKLINLFKDFPEDVQKYMGPRDISLNLAESRLPKETVNELLKHIFLNFLADNTYSSNMSAIIKKYLARADVRLEVDTDELTLLCVDTLMKNKYYSSAASVIQAFVDHRGAPNAKVQFEGALKSHYDSLLSKAEIDEKLRKELLDLLDSVSFYYIYREPNYDEVNRCVDWMLNNFSRFDKDKREIVNSLKSLVDRLFSSKSPDSTETFEIIRKIIARGKPERNSIFNALSDHIGRSNSFETGDAFYSVIQDYIQKSINDDDFDSAARLAYSFMQRISNIDKKPPLEVVEKILDLLFQKPEKFHQHWSFDSIIKICLNTKSYKEFGEDLQKYFNKRQKNDRQITL